MPSCPATPRATASSTPGTSWACGPPPARTPSSRAPSSTTTTSPWCALPASVERGCSRWRCGVGPARLRRRLRGIARRAYDLTIEKMPTRTSVALSRSMAYHPGVQHRVAEMRMDLEVIDAYLERTATDWATGVDHGMEWPLKIVSTKHAVVTRAFAVVDRALDLSGGAGVFKRSRLEQLFRDCRMGRFHPANDLLVHELVGKLSLGISPDDPQRWG
ncbi:MAG: acyl-CoA dehydrogenase family protein [Acidimicrobiales bacterium]